MEKNSKTEFCDNSTLPVVFWAHFKSTEKETYVMKR